MSLVEEYVVVPRYFTLFSFFLCRARRFSKILKNDSFRGIKETIVKYIFYSKIGNLGIQGIKEQRSPLAEALRPELGKFKNQTILINVRGSGRTTIFTPQLKLCKFKNLATLLNTIQGIEERRSALKLCVPKLVNSGSRRRKKLKVPCRINAS